ncbi:MAG: sigma-70 family RNA polymerase sigma factor [Planctomycetes bacterium]|nr:sigma-70 family RNA polymerase sigma factor [Planctomycetota bacterium]
MTLDTASNHVPTDPTEELVQRAKLGDLEAFAELVHAFQGRIFRVIATILPSDRAVAEDLCQEVFLRMHQALPLFDGSARFPYWVHTVATNLAISEYRSRRTKQRGRRTLSIDVRGDGAADGAGPNVELTGRERSPVETAANGELADRVRACVRALPDEFREAVVLCDMELLSYEEIAAVLSVPIGTVRSRIHRGRLLLQEQLQEFLS